MLVNLLFPTNKFAILKHFKFAYLNIINYIININSIKLFRFLTAIISGLMTSRDNIIYLQLQELEVENSQLKKDLNLLRKTVSLGSPSFAQQNLMSNLLLQFINIVNIYWLLTYELINFVFFNI